MQQGYNHIQKVFDEIYDASPTAKEFVKRALSQGRAAPLPPGYRQPVPHPLSPTSHPYNQQWLPKQSVTGRYQVTKLRPPPRPQEIPQEERENVSTTLDQSGSDQPSAVQSRSFQAAKGVPATSFFKEILSKKNGKTIQDVTNQKPEVRNEHAGQWDSIASHRSKTKIASDVARKAHSRGQGDEEPNSDRNHQHKEEDVMSVEDTPEGDRSETGSEISPVKAKKSPKKLVMTESEGEDHDEETGGNQSPSEDVQVEVDPDPPRPRSHRANGTVQKVTESIAKPSPRRTRAKAHRVTTRLPAPREQAPKKDTTREAVLATGRSDAMQPKVNGKIEQKAGHTKKPNKGLVDTPKTTQTTTSTEEPVPVELTPWTIRVRKDGRVVLEGFREDQPDCTWCTSCIANRLSNRLLETSGGTRYKLIGLMDPTLSKEAGMGSTLKKRFKNGFPPPWREYIQEEVSRNNPTFMPDDSLTRRVNTKKRTVPASRKGTEKDPMELNKLPKTRSGRRVKPPMAWWANQRVVVYPFTEIVEIKPPTPSHLSDSHLSDSIIHFKEDTRARRKQERAELQRSFRGKTKNNSLMSSRDSSVDLSESQASADEITSETEQTEPSQVESDMDQDSQDDLDMKTNQESVNVYQENYEESDRTTTKGQSANKHKPRNNRKILKAVRKKVGSKGNQSSLDVISKNNLRRERRISERHLANDESESATSEVDVLEQVDSPAIPKRLQQKQTQHLTDRLKRHDTERLQDEDQGLDKDPLCVSFGSTPVSTLAMRRRTDAGKRRSRPMLTDINEESDNESKSRKQSLLHNQQSRVKQARKETENFDEAEENHLVKKQESSQRKQKTSVKSKAASSKKQSKGEGTGKGKKKEVEERVNSDNVYSEEEVEENLAPARKASGKTARKKANPKPGKTDKGKHSNVPDEPSKKSTKKQSKSKKNKEESTTGKAESQGDVIERSAKEKEYDIEVPDDGEDTWTKAEIADYKKALRELNPAMDHFWHNVAVRVGLKSAEQCQAYHQRSAAPAPHKKKKAPAKAEKAAKPLTLTGGVGTLKRKRELCQMLDAFNDNHEDDFFDATPVRQAKRLKMPMLDEDEDAFFQDRPNTETPLTYRYRTPNARMAWMPTTDKTPVTSLLSPGIVDTVDRKNKDVYAHRLAKERAGPRCRVGTESQTQQKVEKPKNSSGRSELYQNLFKRTNPNQDELDRDSEVEEDYYFSDEDTS